MHIACVPSPSEREALKAVAQCQGEWRCPYCAPLDADAHTAYVSLVGDAPTELWTRWMARCGAPLASLAQAKEVCVRGAQLIIGEPEGHLRRAQVESDVNATEYRGWLYATVSAGFWTSPH